MWPFKCIPSVLGITGVRLSPFIKAQSALDLAEVSHYCFEADSKRGGRGKEEETEPFRFHPGLVDKAIILRRQRRT